MNKNTEQVKLYNTLSKKIEPLTPLEENSFKIYCCGPTVYSYQHIGNFKTFINEDTLVKVLRYAGYKTKHVMNITDVGHNVGDGDDGEDKMLLAARRESKSILDIAKFYTDKFFTDWKKFNLGMPDIICSATQHIQEMIELIKRIEENGFAYVSGGNVYFDTQKMDTYGQLANLNLEDLKAGARIEIDRKKKHPADFVLWFTSSKYENHELQWDSPWGKGYPGWHIECSAMAMKYLGEKFDIHCGGIDHVPVHHCNEIAQSEAATGASWVNYWMHCEHILLNNEKIAKSTGNYLLLDDLEKNGISAAAYKLLVYGTHYRKNMNFSFESLQVSQKSIKRLKDLIVELKAENASPEKVNIETLNDLAEIKSFKAAVFNDLNMPLALASLWELCSSKYSSEIKLAALYNLDQVLGFDMQNWQSDTSELPAEIEKLITARDQARAQKNWAESDRLRDEIKSLGYQVLDSSSGTKVEKV